MTAGSSRAGSLAYVGDLADPSRFHQPIDIAGQDPAVLQGQLRAILAIRMAEHATMCLQLAVPKPV